MLKTGEFYQNAINCLSKCNKFYQNAKKTLIIKNANHKLRFDKAVKVFLLSRI